MIIHHDMRVRLSLGKIVGATCRTLKLGKPGWRHRAASGVGYAAYHPGLFAAIQNFPRIWTGTRDVLVVTDASKGREQLNRNIENEVSALIALLLCEKSI